MDKQHHTHTHDCFSEGTQICGMAQAAQPVEAAGSAAKAELAGWDNSWKVVIGAAAALAQIHIEDEDEREAMMVHVRKIASAIPKLDAQPAACSAQVASADDKDKARQYAALLRSTAMFHDQSKKRTDLAIADLLDHLAAPATGAQVAQAALTQAALDRVMGLVDKHAAAPHGGWRGEIYAAIAAIIEQSWSVISAAPAESAAAPERSEGVPADLSKLTRYDITHYENGAQMEMHPAGEYVEFDDVRALLATHQSTPTGDK